MSISKQLNTGKQPHKRSTYQEGVRELVVRLIRQNPEKDKDDLGSLFLAKVSRDPAHVRVCAEYYWSKQYDYVTRGGLDPEEKAARARDRARRRAQREALTRAAVDGVVDKKVQVRLLEYAMPNGKPLGDCTGKECRDLAPGIIGMGKLVAAVGERLGRMRKTAREVLSEEELRMMQDADF